MLSKKNRIFLAAFLCLAFSSIPDLYAQRQQLPQPYNPVALEHLRHSMEALMIGDYQTSILHCNMVIRLDPESALTYVIRARAYYELNDYDKVIADCTQAIRFDRNNAAAFAIRGNAHGQKNDLTRAISDWQAALRLNPEIDEARHNIELAQQRRNQ
jgi:tetratricopeptide (TPR) repeat protein